MADRSLEDIEKKLDQLIRHCALLEDENTALKANQDEWQQEKARLLEKNEIARTRVEAMIARLKTIDSEA